MRLVMGLRACGVLLLLFVWLSFGACAKADGGADASGEAFVEKPSIVVTFAEAEVAYIGDKAGEGLSDGWVINLRTDMERDDDGNLVGEGALLQISLNALYEEQQMPVLRNLVGSYRSQSNSGDFAPGTFIFGRMTVVDTPQGRVEQPDDTYYASLAEGATDMDIDLIDDGRVDIALNADGSLSISGTLIGKQCRKRQFEWSGEVDVEVFEEQSPSNSLLTSDVELNSLVKAQLQDKGDSFYTKDESYRNFLIFLAAEDISFEWGKPVGSGDVLRLELLVPWQTTVEEGVPAGVYTMLVRNADTSIDRTDIVPFRAVSGLPDRFHSPYWTGSWYINYVEGVWGESYARIDSGTITVERGADGSHRFICDLQDCSSPSYTVSADVTITNDNLIIY